MKKALLLLIAASFTLVDCAQKNVLVTIGKDVYTVEEFKQLYQFSPTDDSTKRMVQVDEFVSQKLCILEARAKGYDSDPVVKAALETNNKAIISRGWWETEVIDRIKIPPAQIRKIYEQVINQYHLAHIAVVEESTALFIEEELRKGVKFEDLVKYSIDTSSAIRGGDLGMISGMQIPETIMDEIKRLKDGGVTKPIKLESFYEIIKLVKHKKLETPTFKEIEQNIHDELLRQKAMEEGEKFFNQIYEGANITYNDTGLAALVKPDSLLKPEDLKLWVVKKYDSQYVYVKDIREAVYYQSQISNLPPRQIIDRTLSEELVYDAAMRAHADRFPKVKKYLQDAQNQLMYQKFYSDMVLEKAGVVDSQKVVDYYRQHTDEFKDKKLEEVFSAIYARLRDEVIATLRTALFTELKKKYEAEIRFNERGLASLLREES